MIQKYLENEVILLLLYLKAKASVHLSIIYLIFHLLVFVKLACIHILSRGYKIKCF